MIQQFDPTVIILTVIALLILCQMIKKCREN